MIICIEGYKYKSFKSKLHVGTILKRTVQDMTNEFQPPHEFTITITKIGKYQVEVKFQDGSKTIYDIKSLFIENWSIIFNNDLYKPKRKNGLFRCNHDWQLCWIEPGNPTAYQYICVHCHEEWVTDQYYDEYTYPERKKHGLPVLEIPDED